MSEYHTETPQTVVLLHGLLRTKYSMLLLARTLRRNGYQVLNFGYPSLRKSIDQHAADLDAFLQQQKNLHITHFATHSLGSIIVRRYAQQYHKNSPKLGRVVMLGPPNQGSSFAKKLTKLPGFASVMGPSFQELCTLADNPLSEKLEVGVIAGGRNANRGYSPLLCGDNDGIVTVEETKLKGAKDSILLPGLHSFLVYYPSIISQTLTFLKEGKFHEGS